MDFTSLARLGIINGLMVGKVGAFGAPLLGMLLGQSGPSDGQPTLFLENWKTVNAHATKESVGSGGAEKVAVRFDPAAYPKIVFEPTTPMDWSGSSGIRVTLFNHQSRPITFGIRVDDDKESNGYLHCRTAVGVIPGETTRAFEVPLDMNLDKLGLKQVSFSGQGKAVGVYGKSDFDMRHIIRWQVFLVSPNKPTFVDIISARLTPKLTFDKIVDPFGQNSQVNYPGKISSVEDLKADAANQSSAPKSSAHLDEYGGWATGPKAVATGFFRTEKTEGKWALVDPIGHLFLSLGMNGVDSGEYKTKVVGRESLFADLPNATDGAAKRFYTDSSGHPGGNLFNYYQYNLSRKFGPDYESKWKTETAKRLKSWGFNTVAGFSDRTFPSVAKMPFTAAEGIFGEVSHIRSGDDHWGPLPDPFDPRFAELAKARLPRVTEKYKSDPYCLGYFIDNELSWGSARARYGLAHGALELAASDSPAKRVFLAQLRAKYGHVTELNRVWGTQFVDWSSLEEPVKLTEPKNKDMGGDFSVFVSAVAEQYFKTIRDEIKRVDPHHLYLGCRFSSYTPEVLAMADKYCDVLSFNIYQLSVDLPEYAFLKELSKPVIISEFHFGAPDRGVMGYGLVAAADQADRANKYQEFIRSAMNHRNVVGCHWFQLLDQPLTGRAFDGENFAVGFISVADRVYPELAEAAKSVHSTIYKDRFGQ